jgi:sorbitol-specific phosphotransferase system component IIBC
MIEKVIVHSSGTLRIQIPGRIITIRVNETGCRPDEIINDIIVSDVSAEQASITSNSQNVKEKEGRVSTT